MTGFEPWTSEIRSDNSEGLYLPDSQTVFIIVLKELSPWFHIHNNLLRGLTLPSSILESAASCVSSEKALRGNKLYN